MNGHLHIELAAIRSQQLIDEASARRLARTARRGRRAARRGAEETTWRAVG